MQKSRLIGRRVATARAVAGLTPEDLAADVGLSLAEVVALEDSGQLPRSAQLIAIADALTCPLAYLVADPVPALENRGDGQSVADCRLSMELESLAIDVRQLLAMGLLGTHREAERDRDGLQVYTAPLDSHGYASGYVAGHKGDVTAGVAVINGSLPDPDRQAVEKRLLGHWLAGDAIHLETGSAGATGYSESRSELSANFTDAVLRGYTDGRLTRARALEMLRGTRTDLPPPHGSSFDSLRPAFNEH